MRNFYFLFLIVALLAGCAAPASSVNDQPKTWFIFLETGKKSDGNKEAMAERQRGHIANFQRLFGEKKLQAAGPMADPSTLKRGIVVVQAANRDVLKEYFLPDAYVSEGYMTLNATPARVRKSLNTEGVTPDKIEEGRILMISRPVEATGAATHAAGDKFLQGLLDSGAIGAWYSLESGPIAEVMFVKSTDSAAMEKMLSAHPQVVANQATVSVWRQWLSRGVVPG